MPRPIMLLAGTTIDAHCAGSAASEFLIAMPHDVGPMLPAWPRDLIEEFSSAIAKWREHNAGRRILALTTACTHAAPAARNPFTATVVLHHVAIPQPATGEDHGGT